MNFIQLTAKETGIKVLINLKQVHDIRQIDGETTIDFGNDEPVWVVSESVEDIAAALNASNSLINI